MRKIKSSVLLVICLICFCACTKAGGETPAEPVPVTSEPKEGSSQPDFLPGNEISQAASFQVPASDGSELGDGSQPDPVSENSEPQKTSQAAPILDDGKLRGDSQSDPVSGDSELQNLSQASSASEDVKPQNEHFQSPLPETDGWKILKDVMAGERTFYDVEAAEEIKITELKQALDSDGKNAVEISDFLVMDLDEDGVKEIVLWLVVNGNEYYGYEILHCQDEEVYGYRMYYRSFNSLKADGTFHFSSSSADKGIGRVKFDASECLVEKIAASQSSYNKSNELEVSYWVNGQETSQEVFEAEMEKQDKKSDALWYDFTDENVKQYLS